MIKPDRVIIIQPLYSTATRANQRSIFQGMQYFFILREQDTALVFSFRNAAMFSGDRPREYMASISGASILTYQSLFNISPWPWQEVTDIINILDAHPLYAFIEQEQVSQMLGLKLLEYGSEELWVGLEELYNKVFGNTISVPNTRHKRVIQIEEG